MNSDSPIRHFRFIEVLEPAELKRRRGFRKLVAGWLEAAELLSLRTATSLPGKTPADAQTLYDGTPCPRGEMENRIKEQQLGLFSDRTFCHAWWANQFRVLLSAMAYVFLEYIRRVGLAGTELARAQVSTIRVKVLKIGTVIVRNTRRLRLLFSSAYPYQELFQNIMAGFFGFGAAIGKALHLISSWWRAARQ